MEGCWGFWTAESWGPRFLIELILEFSAGAFFPLDVLPPTVQSILKCAPSPYLVFFPLNIYLERLSTIDIARGFAIELMWIVTFAALTRFVWTKGLAAYEAEGS